MKGSSPQVRGRSTAFSGETPRDRLIPAGAGQMPHRAPCGTPPAAHPRRCGADPTEEDRRTAMGGSSPQVRGRCTYARIPPWLTWLIPAGAGQMFLKRRATT
ncbi:hypothetical protein HMPREF0294_0591 [Corynebacterium glucuronolyticum ATCC 51867]|nr:hypothetical protein HMPREF0294_0591 [Corynebacterium glucuronolyticum ATCC 51867]